MSNVLTTCPSCATKNVLLSPKDNSLAKCPSCSETIFPLGAIDRRSDARIPVTNVRVEFGIGLGAADVRDISQRGVGLSPLDSDVDLAVGQELFCTLFSTEMQISGVLLRVVYSNSERVGCVFQAIDQGKISSLVRMFRGGWNLS